MPPPNKLLKYLLDIEQVISEIEEIKKRYEGDFREFQADWIAIRAVELDLQIIGEAVNAILKIDPTIIISSARNIVDLRNLIVHAYDAVDNAMLWGIIQKDIVLLKSEGAKLKG